MTTGKDRRQSALLATAHHEAGHAVIGVWLRLRFRSVSIEPEGDHLGRVLFRNAAKWVMPDHDINPRTFDFLERHIISSLAGYEAERRFTGRRSRGRAFSSDYLWVSDIIGRFAGESLELQRVYWRLYEIRSKLLVASSQHWTAITKLANELVAKPTMNEVEARAVIFEGWRRGQEQDEAKRR